MLSGSAHDRNRQRCSTTSSRRGFSFIYSLTPIWRKAAELTGYELSVQIEIVPLMSFVLGPCQSLVLSLSRHVSSSRGRSLYNLPSVHLFALECSFPFKDSKDLWRWRGSHHTFAIRFSHRAIVSGADDIAKLSKSSVKLYNISIHR